MKEPDQEVIVAGGDIAVGLIAERRVGQTGRLLISTFRLSTHLAKNPVAAWMLRDMAERLAAKDEARIVKAR